MKIAIIAWGSLIWDRQNLGLAGNFEPDGPDIPIEFCRISNDGRLTLVIDEKYGAICRTYRARSVFDDLDRAIEDLRVREGMPGTANVGFVNLVTGHSSITAAQRHPTVMDAIRVWAVANGYDSVIWTALGKNFSELKKANEAFSIEAAIRYLDGRDKLCFARALHYVWNAPVEIQTPVRAAIKLNWPEKITT